MEFKATVEIVKFNVNDVITASGTACCPGLVCDDLG